MKKGIIRLRKRHAILSHAAAVGKKEHSGPLGHLFDYHDDSDRFGQDSWEMAESEMQHLALNLALGKKKLSPADTEAIFAGDLINQCTGSAYGLRDFSVPYFGIYGACSTSAEALILGALFREATGRGPVAAVTSSHNCTAERQFRFPVEYGGLRTPTSQWTVTGAAAFLIGEGDGAVIAEVLPGIIRDEGITDANNMGAAMAPAAADTIGRYFGESGKRPEDFDGIFTGDLGFEGHRILLDALKEGGLDLTRNGHDCGLLIFDRERQKVQAGGSGCGCGGSVLASFILPRLESGEYRHVLYVATGALMSPMAVQQGQTIPGIAHLIHLVGENGGEEIC